MNAAARKAVGLALSAAFAAVGGLFLLAPDGVLRFLNSLGRGLGMAEAPSAGLGFYSILAVAYMAFVTALAWRMFRAPSEPVYPLLLAQAKGASSLLSFGLLVFQAPYFAYLANGVVDGILAIAAYLVYGQIKKSAGARPG